MSHITIQEVRHLASLARINLDPAHEEQMVAELDSIKSLIDQLQLIDTEGIEPTNQVSGNMNVTRPDEIQVLPSPDELLSKSSNVYAGQFKVPKVL